MSGKATPKPKAVRVDEMTEDELLDMLVDLIRSSKVHNFYDRKCFRVVAKKLKSLGFKLTP
jgi:hypothetical protein